ncbi:unnamed protein product [Withania somnifera]
MSDKGLRLIKTSGTTTPKSQVAASTSVDANSHFISTMKPYAVKNAGLKIPIAFLKYLKGLRHIKHAVLRNKGKKWLVKVNCWQLQEGWKKFAKEHDLQLGDLLIFKHEGDMEFEVSIFDSIHCDREYTEYLQEEEVNSAEEASKKVEFKEAATHNRSCLSRFECIAKPYCISNGFLRLPRQFARANGLMNKKCGLIISDERQRSWNLRLATYCSSVHVFGGWDDFCIVNNLKAGDYMMFEVVANGEKPIWKFHTIKDIKQKTSDVTTRISQLPASTSVDTHPHFISTIKHYTFTKSILYFPMNFVKSNGLMSRSEMILVDEKQRSWSVWIGQMERHFGIKSGWPQFRKANDVQLGDTYKFELTNNGTMPIVHCKLCSTLDGNDPTRLKPHFLKPIHKGFKNGLKIPTGFLKYVKGLEHIEYAILKRAGKKWLVKVKCWRFEAGWAEFVEQHDVQLGDLLIFRHEGDMEFEVSIFDSSHCDREYAEYLQGEGGNNVEETSKNFEFKGKLNLCVMSSSKAFPHAEAGTHNPCGKSHFECTVRPYCISNGYLRLPKQFATENSLINKKCDVIIKDERQRSWNLRLATHNSIVHVLGGWGEFCVANDLKEGDYMMFEVIANGEKPIWKFHNKPNPNIVSSRKAFPKEESAIHSSFGQSHFVCTVRPYSLSRNFLWLPKEFARGNGLVNKKCDLVIRDERQRSWNLRLDNSRYRVYIAKGWSKFCVDNDLKEGDCITFEVVTNGEKSIWKFQESTTHNSFGQSHFVCTVKQYCLSRNYLVSLSFLQNLHLLMVSPTRNVI